MEKAMLAKLIGTLIAHHGSSYEENAQTAKLSNVYLKSRTLLDRAPWGEQGTLVSPEGSNYDVLKVPVEGHRIAIASVNILMKVSTTQSMNKVRG